jgi:hypothetical protein
MATKEQKTRWAREYKRRKQLGLPQAKRGDNLRRHGLTKSPEHRSWLSMMTRCFWSGPERSDYHLYQGKGITVCDRWRDFSNFLADMGPKPTAQHTLDRIDGNGNYEPSNCRWVTSREQTRNTSRNSKLTFNGRTMILNDWAAQIGIARESLRDRLMLWPLDEALTRPPVRVRKRDSKGRYVVS